MKFQQQAYCVRIDSSSKFSFINTNVVRHAESLVYNANRKSNTVHLADNSLMEIPGQLFYQLLLRKRNFRTSF